ncbi:DUF1036 domain-containing protein [Paracoccus aurantiacus]|uniref:DUF1036 domain-containing protein n=1 Tax=Paracoccus aurantiacus TaxID=2599412 RepID=A0A5C6S8L1_9RHOB|nr:DUF1036 domain-containing protein [Paracoccus aurantiacus]TXB71189.1 DUF1036 domain-containing protein [Paracoccus aurantiacus]
MTVRASFLILLACWVPQGASASLSLCNQSFDVLNIAIAEPSGGQFRTRGWWRVAPNQCATLLHDALHSRFYYLFAADVFGNEALPGSTPMCIATAKFDITGQQDCLIRGYLDARFYEVDTQEQDSWTIFVSPRP